MKRPLTKRFSLVALIIAILFTTYIITGILSFSVTTIDYAAQTGGIVGPDSRINDTAFGGLFYTPDIDENLPYHQYKKIADSIENIKKERDYEFESHSISGRSFGSIGIGAIPMMNFFAANRIEREHPVLLKLEDSASRLRDRVYTTQNKDSVQILKKLSGLVDQERESFSRKLNDSMNKVMETDKLYYLKLQPYTLDYFTKFYISKGQYYLAYPEPDSVDLKTGYKSNYGHYASKQIPIRYASESKEILIPITQAQYKTLDAILWIVLIVLLFAYAYVFVGLPAQILINISRGKAFVEKNIRALGALSWAALILFLIKLFFAPVMHFAFRKMIPEDFKHESFYELFSQNIMLFFITVALFIVKKAFQRGHKLQQEQALTI